MSIAIVVDSVADLPDDYVAANSIYVIPAIVVIDGKSLEDGYDISREEYYRRLPALKQPPTTAAPSVGSFEQLYEKIFSQGFEKIVSVHISAMLSGVYNSACVAAQRFGERVCVLDSGQLSLGYGFQVIALNDALRAGATLADAIERMNDIQHRLHVIVMLESLEYVYRSGRVSWAAAGLGVLLNLKFFIELKNGVPKRIGETRTRRRGIKRLHHLLMELGPLEYLAILHTNALDDAENFRATITQSVEKGIIIANATPILGIHLGPNGLGFAAVTER